MNTYGNEIKLFLLMGVLCLGIGISGYAGWLRIEKTLQTYSPYVGQAIEQLRSTPLPLPITTPEEELLTSTPNPTNSPALRTTTSPRATPFRAAQSTRPPSTASLGTCAGVTYNGTCYTQMCVDLDAKNMFGTDGDQYYTASRIYWVPENRQVQFVNEDYCDPSTGELIEYYCTAEGQAGSIRVADSKCTNNKL